MSTCRKIKQSGLPVKLIVAGSKRGATFGRNDPLAIHRKRIWLGDMTNYFDPLGWLFVQSHRPPGGRDGKTHGALARDYTDVFQFTTNEDGTVARFVKVYAAKIWLIEREIPFHISKRALFGRNNNRGRQFARPETHHSPRRQNKTRSLAALLRHKHTL